MQRQRATPNHLTAVKQLLQNAYYRYVDMGMEDLPGLLAGGAAALGQEASQGQAWGFVGVQVEERPITMPNHAPTRGHLRAVAFQHNHAPEIELGRLMRVIVADQAEPYPVQYLCYGAEYWLSKALKEAGFTQVEAVQFYQLDRLRSRLHTLPPIPEQLSFTPLYPAQLDELAILDAATFDPLWHFGHRDLFELLMRGRMQVAWWEGEMVGYSAVCANTQSEAQLARLAVLPTYQGRGIGRALLSDAIRYAAGDFSVLVLNTQINNNRSQSLYRGLGFRPIGMSLAVLGLTVA
jgi:ribosomal protein S18 acetylase RimI-like enzyme